MSSIHSLADFLKQNPRPTPVDLCPTVVRPPLRVAPREEWLDCREGYDALHWLCARYGAGRVGSWLHLAAAQLGEDL